MANTSDERRPRPHTGRDTEEVERKMDELREQLRREKEERERERRDKGS